MLSFMMLMLSFITAVFHVVFCSHYGVWISCSKLCWTPVDTFKKHVWKACVPLQTSFVGRLVKLFSSSSGRSWAATTTEGLLVYSLDGSLVFDPYDLDLDVTPASIRKQLRLQEWASAIVLAFRLNEKALKQEVLEKVPHEQSEWISPYLTFWVPFFTWKRPSDVSCASFWPSLGGLRLSSWHLCREAAGFHRHVFGEVGPLAVLYDLGPEPAHAARTETEEQVCPQALIHITDSVQHDCKWTENDSNKFFNASALACRSGAILPTLQALQKSIQRHFDDLSKL